MGERIQRFFEQHNEKIHHLGESWDTRSEAHEAKAMDSQTAGVSSNRVCLSLLSGLPNEQEFALNVCVLLSNDEHSALRLNPSILQLLLAQTGIWLQMDLRVLYAESWQGVEGRNMHRFWRTTLCNKDIPRILEIDLGECDEEEFWNLETSNLEAEGQRVMKVALILHNLSFEKDNVPVLVNSTIFIRFLLLSIHSSWANLKQTALDTLANISHQVRLDSGECWSSVLLGCVKDGLLSPDRFVSLRSMDILSQLCASTPNDELIPSHIGTQTYQRLVSFLTVHDTMLLFYTLEALYALSDLGKQTCDHIAHIHSAIGVLVNLLTLDPVQYGPEAEIKMKLVEILVPAEPTEQPSEKEATVSAVPQESPAIPLSSIQVAPKEVNSETFANNWLKSQYEMFPGGLISRNEIYADYVGCCTKAERRGVLNANAFANCVKSCFPHVDLKKVQSSGGIITFHHDGLRRKRSVAVNKAAAVKPLHSPILQAQLSTPKSEPKPSSTLIKSLLATKVQQRTVQVPPRQVLPLQRHVVLSGGQGGKMLIFSPGGKSPGGMVRCMVPNIHRPPIKLIQQVNGIQSDMVSSKSSCEVPTIPMSSILNNANSSKEEVTSIPSKDSCIVTDQNFILSQIQGNTITYRLANPEELTLSSGNRLFLRSKPTDEQNGIFLNNKAPEPKPLPAVDIPSEICNALSQGIVENSGVTGGTQNVNTAYNIIAKPQEDICKKSPLLNGLLDRGQKKPLSGDILFNALVENGIEASDAGLELSSEPPKQSIIIPSPSLDSFILPSSSLPVSSLDSIVLKPEPLEVTPNKSLVATPLTSNYIILPQPSFTVASASSSNKTSFAIANGSCGLVHIRSGQATFSGTAELQPDQTGVVRLHIESPENSNQGDLSSISEITRTLECASEAISRTNAECKTQVPQNSAPVTYAPNIVVGNAHDQIVGDTVAINIVGQDAISKQSDSILDRGVTNTGSGNLMGQGSLSCLSAVNSHLQTANSGQSAVSLTGNFINQNALSIVTSKLMNKVVASTVSDIPSSQGVVNSVAGHIISNTAVNPNDGCHASANSMVGTLLSQGAVNTLSGKIVTQNAMKTVADNITAHSIVNTVSSNMSQNVMKTLAGNIIGHSIMNTVASNLVGQNVKTVAGNVIGQSIVSTVSSNLVGQNVVKTVAGNLIGQSTVSNNIIGLSAGSVNTVGGSLLGQGAARSNQQIFVVTSPAMGQQQSPNIKFCILHTMPMSEDNAESSPPEAKRPSSDQLCINVKKPRLDVRTPSTLPGNMEVDPPALKVSSDLSSETKTFSGLTSAGNDLLSAAIKAPPSSAKLEFVCEWKSCGLKFLKPGQVFVHASRVHTPPSVEVLPCLWEGCDNMKRRRLSLLTHIQDWHCSERILQLAAARRLQVAREGHTSITPPPKPPPHPGYAPDAAVLAIKRHALQYNNPKELEEEKESALTKSIRLTSALILRNLVMHSSLARTYVRRFEAELAYLAMSPVESAKTIAQCLCYLSSCD